MEPRDSPWAVTLPALQAEDPSPRPVRPTGYSPGRKTWEFEPKTHLPPGIPKGRPEGPGDPVRDTGQYKSKTRQRGAGALAAAAPMLHQPPRRYLGATSSLPARCGDSAVSGEHHMAHAFYFSYKLYTACLLCQGGGRSWAESFSRNMLCTPDLGSYPAALKIIVGRWLDTRERRTFGKDGCFLEQAIIAFGKRLNPWVSKYADTQPGNQSHSTGPWALCRT
jgi:hypothetical protein